MNKKRKKQQTISQLIITLNLFIAIYVFSTTADIKKSAIIFAIGAFVSMSLVSIYRTKKLKDERKKYLESGIDIVDKMNGEEFEHFLLAHFSKMGYKGAVTKSTGDYGADLVLNKGQEKIIVQAKRWKEKVGIKAIQEALGAMSYYKADKGMVVTNNFFTKSAYELAQSSNIELWDRKKLIDIMALADGKSVAREVTVESDIEGRCPSCGSDLVKRNGKKGMFYGCSSFPKCRYTKSLN